MAHDQGFERRRSGAHGCVVASGPSGRRHEARGPERGEQKDGGRCRDQVVRVQEARHPAGGEGTGDGAELAAEADRGVEPPRLRDRVDLAEQQPERDRRERRDESRPDVERAQRPGPRGAGHPEQERSQRAHGPERRQRSTLGEAAGPRAREQDGDRRERQVHPGQLVGGQPGQEQRVPPGFQHGVRGEPAEEHEEGRQSDAELTVADVDQPDHGARPPFPRFGAREDSCLTHQGPAGVVPTRSRRQPLRWLGKTPPRRLRRREVSS